MKGSLRQLSLTELGETIGTPPASNLVSSVQNRGVIQPIVVAETPNSDGVLTLNILDGNRRIAAARRAMLDQIPAIVFTEINPADASSITLILNSFRASNYLTEFWAIRQLERNGFTEPEIKSIGDINATKWKQRSSLSNLDRELFVALRNSKIFQTHAVEIAKLPSESQQSLAETFRYKGRLSQHDLAPYKIRKGRKTSPLPSSTVSWKTEESASITRTGFPQPHPAHVPPATPPDPVAPEPRPKNAATSVQASAAAFAPARKPHTHQLVPESTPSIPEPGTTFTNRLNTLMRNTVVAARDMDYSKEELLELAARKWDEVNG